MTVTVETTPSAGRATTDTPNSASAVSTARAVIRRIISWDSLVVIVFFAILVGVWYLVSGAVGTATVSSPGLVVKALWHNLQNGQLTHNTWATLKETILGLALGVIGGVIAGVLLGSAPGVIRRGLYPYILGAYSLPRVALAPFFVLWFGIGLESKVFLVTSVVGFVVLLNVRQGLQAIDRDTLDVLRTMKASPVQMVRYVIVPSLVPWIISATKISVGLAVVSAVVAEMIGATEGLGWQVTFALSQADMTTAMASLIMMSILALVLYAAVALIERRVLRWQASGAGLERQKTTAL